MDELISWLRHQWSTDEQWAQAAMEDTVSRGSQVDDTTWLGTARTAEEILARIEAERRIVEEYEKRVRLHQHDDVGYAAQRAVLDDVVRLLASGYRGRDGYREEWTPHG